MNGEMVFCHTSLTFCLWEGEGGGEREREGRGRGLRGTFISLFQRQKGNGKFYIRQCFERDSGMRFIVADKPQFPVSTEVNYTVVEGEPFEVVLRAFANPDSVRYKWNDQHVST